MSLIKEIIKVLTLAGLILGSAPSVYAFESRIEVSNLTEWTRTNDLEISYSALSDGAVNVHFCYKKEGESYKKFGPTFNTPSGKIQVTGSQMNDQMVKHYFKAILNGADCSGVATDETSTIYDYSQPSPVSDLKKEYKGNGYWRLTWKNPHDPDFMKVIIYRSESTSFTADGITRVGETGGAYNTEVSWDNYGLDPNKKYYFAVRALDKAGNASGAVGDPETVVVLGAKAPTPFPEEKVVITPKVSPTKVPTKVLSETSDDTELGSDSGSSDDNVVGGIGSGSPAKEDDISGSESTDKSNSFVEMLKSSVEIKTAISVAVILGIVFLIYLLLKRQNSQI